MILFNKDLKSYKADRANKADLVEVQINAVLIVSWIALFYFLFFQS